MNGLDNAVLTTADWLLPDILTTVVATNASAVAVNVMVVDIPDTSAVTVFVPAVEPSVSVD